jgi:hydrogenase-4 component B
VQHLETPPLWWGWTLIFIGLASGIGGVLFALAQHDLKRLLAYHSVENIGIIALGLGIGLVGWSTGIGTVCLLGLAGALLHVVNHAVFKSLLFLGAGAIHHATHSLDMDHLGGLLKRMPRTGGPFLVGALAISGLPPLNGFVSEFLIFLAGLTGIAQGMTAALAPSVAVVAGLALISGLAAACFTKAFGGVFLGEPRDERMQQAHDPGRRMQVPMFGLTVMCFAIGLGGPVVLPWLYDAALAVRPELSAEVSGGVYPAMSALTCVTAVFSVFLLVSCGLALLRRALLRGRAVGTAGTWDCGYAAPTARMQYTSSSFAEPLTQLFQVVLRTRRREPLLAEPFPAHATFGTDTPDTCMEGVYRPAFKGIEQIALYLRWLQHGNIHLYILYIAVTLLILLVWKLG